MTPYKPDAMLVMRFYSGDDLSWGKDTPLGPIVCRGTYANCATYAHDHGYSWKRERTGHLFGGYYSRDNGGDCLFLSYAP